MQHLNIFGPIALSSSSVIGTKIRLDRPTDREHGCCDNVAIIGKATSLTCTTCGAFRGWLSAEAAAFIMETRARFGAPDSIVLRTPRAPPAPAARIDSAVTGEK